MADIFTCPVCTSDVDIGSVLVEHGVKGIVPPSQGVRCRACRTVLDIVQYKVFIAIILMFGAMILAANLLANIGIDAEAATVVLLILTMYPAIKAFDWFTELRVPNADKKLKSDDDIWTDPDHVDPAYAQYVAREINLAGHEYDTGDRALSADWSCAHCGEENTKEFHSCWKCGDSHDSLKD